nr:hypothetical protein [Tanacetum cinerariifolium]
MYDNDVETLQEEKDVVDGKLARLLKSSKELEDIIEGQRSEKVKEGVGYNAVPPPAAFPSFFQKSNSLNVQLCIQASLGKRPG